MHATQQPSIWPGRGTACLLAILFAVVLAYSSTILGPIGINYVPRDPQEALRIFLHMQFRPNGSDQQADWMGNLLTLVPYGFLVTATVWPRRTWWLRPGAFLLAMLLCLATILVVKYLQVFFPPRTVTLNYVLAQTLGSLIGSIGFIVWHASIGPVVLRPRDPVRALVILLRLYLLALVVFLLMPLDFALTPKDLVAQLDRLPAALTLIPGEERPLPVRVLLLGASIAAFVPVGVLLVLRMSRTGQVLRGMAPAFLRGLVLNLLVFAASTLVIGANPGAIAIAYRMLGVILGAAGMRWIARQNLPLLRGRLARLVPWLVVPYLLALALANQLVSADWRSWDQAMVETTPLGRLPLFDYYIVTKAEAAKNIVAHLLMYLPIGIAVWLCGPRRGRGMIAFLLGATVSVAVEIGRYLRPGLEGDINAVVVGGVAAAVALPVMDRVWDLLAAVARSTASGAPSGAPAAYARPARWQDDPRVTDRPTPTPDGPVEYL